MDMTSNECLAYIVNEIHSTVFATADKHGNPVTCAIVLWTRQKTDCTFDGKRKKFL